MVWNGLDHVWDRGVRMSIVLIVPPTRCHHQSDAAVAIVDGMLGCCWTRDAGWMDTDPGGCQWRGRWLLYKLRQWRRLLPFILPPSPVVNSRQVSTVTTRQVSNHTQHHSGLNPTKVRIFPAFINFWTSFTLSVYTCLTTGEKLLQRFKAKIFHVKIKL